MPEQLTVHTIDQYISEFRKVIEQRGRHPNRFYARGLAMEDLRDKVYERLQKGWELMLKLKFDSPEREKMENLWMDLLMRYETICDMIAGENVDLVDVVKSMYNARDVSDV